MNLSSACLYYNLLHQFHQISIPLFFFRVFVWLLPIFLIHPLGEVTLIPKLSAGTHKLKQTELKILGLHVWRHCYFKQWVTIWPFLYSQTIYFFQTVILGGYGIPGIHLLILFYISVIMFLIIWRSYNRTLKRLFVCLANI